MFFVDKLSLHKRSLRLLSHDSRLNDILTSIRIINIDTPL